MYTPPSFQVVDITDVHRTMREARTATLITATHEGLVGTMLPVVLDEREGSMGTIYAHVARANPQWKLTPAGEAMAIFAGPEAYVSPSWYVTKHERGEAVPTWNYVAVHAYGPIEFFDDADRLRRVVTRLTDVHERSGKDRWAVSDAPADFIKTELKGIVGLRLQITRFDGTRKMSQNRNAADRAGVIEGLSKSDRDEDRRVAHLIAMTNPNDVL
ncbi:FMN-binding negative transcriptional regulator [Bradyrhizobium sp. 24]|uniref:FMN-binding negative transcriptional regulator n=1 Tax=unclassified Bradyrhizobium TaxID=2631580 RepID=UPI001FF7A7A7|nr:MULTISPECIES: FMN-binding negative transcriptional regulator [unclassified Bradyrhizobium]MCK1379128.1 FMN-binding negative transcriptional regulator [Bradyrhizobium sp. 24]MCK1303772.1 FMN-binding negative transcriptional regulator [Bradyrhizobium sp. 37]MCK1343112.1 FMN-binding negative transcriptional regulator [Bradyrhizobium sp. CW11]MCK1585442.1 FMN-binding negative transcriptional regulator [Bradyrhizobium sp. 168]MCK1686009.1 FMN-binding negative transcriptional regulator [Bradyrhiz